MKRIILLCYIFLLFLVNLQAQRRYGHFSRVKVDKQAIVVDSVVDSFTEINGIHKNENTIVPLSVIPVLERTSMPVIIKKNYHKPVIDQDIKEEINTTNFITGSLENYRKLQDVEDTKKTMLRTWLWLFIVACTLLVLGMIFLIIGYGQYNAGKNGNVMIALGYGFAGLGFIGGIIILILGLSGRI